MTAAEGLPLFSQDDSVPLSFNNDEDAAWTLAKGAVVVDRCSMPAGCITGSAQKQLLSLCLYGWRRSISMQVCSISILTSGSSLDLTRAPVAGRSHWGRIRVSGDDRATFLHGQSTADITALSPGEGCDTVFVTAQVSCCIRIWMLLGRPRCENACDLLHVACRGGAWIWPRALCSPAASCSSAAQE